MKFIFFTLLGMAFMFAIMSVDWDHKFDDFVNQKYIKKIHGFFDRNPKPIPSSDSVAVDSTADSLDIEDLLLALPNIAEAQSPLHKPNQADSEISSLNQDAQPPEISARQSGFNDVSEEPYLDESRRLMQQIRQNYGEITKDKNSRQPRRP